MTGRNVSHLGKRGGEMLSPLLAQVRHNCHLASSAQAGYYSLCGFLLRLRALYKWEQGWPPWREPEPEAVLEWVAGVESAWEALEDAPLADLEVQEETFGPFEIEALNARLQSLGLAYGAGYTRGLAPTFFLGELLERRQEDGLTILILGDEWARDLDGTPALRQGSLIYARRQALEYYLWDRLSDPAQQGDARVAAALAAFGLELHRLVADPERYREGFRDLAAVELETYIRHEIGEAQDTELGEAFPLLLELFPQTRIELWLRGLKDALADVHEAGRLAYIIERRLLASAALFFAFQPGLYPLLLPEVNAVSCRLLAGDWQALAAARQAARDRLAAEAAQVRELTLALADTPARLGKELSRRFLAPLGL
ncbi:MAG: Sfum_1244 family protein [Desulfobaccales bacterium]